jgi:hypothetical protein
VKKEETEDVEEKKMEPKAKTKVVREPEVKPG